MTDEPDTPETPPRAADAGEPPPLPPAEPAPPVVPPPAAFTPGILRALQRTQPWVRVLGVVGLVMSSLMLLFGIGAGVIGIATQQPQTVVLMVLYPLIAILYVVPSIYLLRYATRIRAFVAQGLAEQLEAALDTQRALWKFVGILAIVSLAMSVGFFVLAVLFGLLAGFGMQAP